MLPNVSFTGRCGAGKSTAADYLVSKHRYVKLSFANKLKEIAVNSCRMIGKDRELLQNLGLSIREIDPDFWIKALFRTMDKLKGPFVIDDCRFLNEYKYLNEIGFKFYRVLRDRDVRLSSQGIDPSKQYTFETHESETNLDSLPITNIYNNSTKENFYTKIDMYMQEYLTNV